MQIKPTITYHYTPCDWFKYYYTDNHRDWWEYGANVTFFFFVGEKTPCFHYTAVSHSYQNESAIPFLCVYVQPHPNLDMDVSSSSMQNHPITTPPKWNSPSASEWINYGTLIQRGKRNRLLIHTALWRDVKICLQSAKCWSPKLCILKRQDCSDGDLVNGAESTG